MERTKKQNEYFKEFFTKNKMYFSLKALELVNEAHKGLRKDGKPEKSHLFEVLGFAISQYEKRISCEDLDKMVTVHALHDLVEDYAEEYSFKNLKKYFPIDVIKSLKKVTKWKTFKKTDRDYKHYHRNIGKDFNAIITKANDRIHNFSSCMCVFNPEKKKLYILETEKYIIPNLKKARREYPEYYISITSQIQLLKMLMEFVNNSIKE